MNQSSMRHEPMNVSKSQHRAGAILSGVAILFFLFDGTMKVFKSSQSVEATVGLGYRESMIIGIGLTLLVCTMLYILPRTSVLGAILLTGYLGGAVASNVRAGTALFNIVFPIIFACLVWVGLWLRDHRLRGLIPITKHT